MNLAGSSKTVLAGADLLAPDAPVGLERQGLRNEN